MLEEGEILSFIRQELSRSDPETANNDEFGVPYERALRMYYGQPDGREVEGSSQVTSTDVADAIEWIMPQIMKSFTQNNQVVIFDPIHPGDEQQAELESEYVYEVLMKQNDGFIIIHQFVKDALMQQNGILKVYYANRNMMKVCDYTGIIEDQLQALMGAEGVEILEQSKRVDQVLTLEKQQMLQQQLQQAQQQAQQSQQEIPPEMLEKAQAEMEKPVYLYDVKIAVERIRGQIYIDPVPPEEFRINTDHNSINPDSARFTAHVVRKTISEIMEEYDIDYETAMELPQGTQEGDSEYRREVVTYGDDSDDDSQRLIEVSECYMLIDIDETGIAQRMKIDVAGGDDPTHILSQDRMDSMPWVATTAFVMSHTFKGRSITDRLAEIQHQKTALWRNMFDNIYLQNNQRNVVIENQVNMDDLLVSRPGGIIRAKRIDSIMPLATPQMGKDVYQMMDYLDRVRAGRAGVDPDGNATPQSIGDRVGSEGVDRLLNAKEELVGLITRVVAETGLKPLCVKIRDLSVKHVDAVQDFQFRGVWHKINPAQWEDRFKCTVRVGTGTGHHRIKVGALQQIIALQKEIFAQPGQTLVNPKKVFDTLDDYCRFNDLNGANRYFVDPGSPEGQQAAKQASESQQQAKQQQQQQEQALLQAQLQVSQAEVAKAEAQGKNVELSNQIAAQKVEYETQLKALKQQLDEATLASNAQDKDKDRSLKRYEIDQRTAVELTRIGASTESEGDDTFNDNKEKATS